MFSFVQITDHHLLESEDMLVRGYAPAHAFRRVLRHIAEHRPDADFVVTTGDIANLGTEAEYRRLRDMLGLDEYSPAPGPQRISTEGLRGKPMYFLPGNHDPRDVFFRAMFPASFADCMSEAPAMNVSFTHKGVRFVCVDWGIENKAVSTDAMLDHLRCSLDGTPSIVLSHHNVTPAGMPRLDALVADDIGRFEDAIRDRNVLAIFNGHTHATYESRIADVPVYGLRSTYFSFAQAGDEFCYVLRPPHYRMVTVDGTTVTSEVVEVVL